MKTSIYVQIVYTLKNVVVYERVWLFFWGRAISRIVSHTGRLNSLVLVALVPVQAFKYTHTHTIYRRSNLNLLFLLLSYCKRGSQNMQIIFPIHTPITPFLNFALSISFVAIFIMHCSPPNDDHKYQYRVAHTCTTNEKKNNNNDNTVTGGGGQIGISHIRVLFRECQFYDQFR